jgi:magnesium-transporting ATPase (P-type)
MQSTERSLRNREGGLESITYSLTTILIGVGILVAVVALFLEQAGRLQRYEVVMLVSGRAIALALLMTISLGWFCALRYLLHKRGVSARLVDYVLLLVVVFLPIAAIYVLRIARRRDDLGSDAGC